VSWSWRLERDFEGTFWQTVGDQPLPHSRTYFFDSWSNDKGPCFINEGHSAHKIIEAAKELDPLRCQLYRLVYGSLP
jgi:hypothetical protein